MERNLDYQKFAENLGILAEGLGASVSVAQIEAYWRVLERFDAAQVFRALNLSLETFQFFPKPVQILELMQGSPTDRAERAWQYLLDALSDGAGQYHSCYVQDGACAKAIARCWGSVTHCFNALRELGPNEPMYASQRKAFISAYCASLREDCEPRYFAGACELNNRTLSHALDYQQPVVLIGAKGASRVNLLFSGKTGELMPDARRALGIGDADARNLQLQAPTDDGFDLAMPDEVREYLEATPQRKRIAQYLRLVEPQEQEDAA